MQEALTNAIKYAQSAPTDVHVRWTPAALELTVADRGGAGGAGGDGVRATAWSGCASACACTVGSCGRDGATAAASSPARDLPVATRRWRRMTIARLLIADDQALVRAGFRMILDAEEDLDVVGEAPDGPRRSTPRAGSSPTSC